MCLLSKAGNGGSLRFLEAPPLLGFKMGFFVKQGLEVLVGSAGWDEKVGPTPRLRGEAPMQT